MWFRREVAATEVRKQSCSEVGVQRRTTARLGEGEEQQKVLQEREEQQLGHGISSSRSSEFRTATSAEHQQVVFFSKGTTTRKSNVSSVGIGVEAAVGG